MEIKSIKKTLELVKSKKISVKELANIYIEKIKKNKNLNAFIYFDEKIVLEQAEKIDNIKEDLPLKGIPLGIKDLFCTKKYANNCWFKNFK